MARIINAVRVQKIEKFANGLLGFFAYISELGRQEELSASQLVADEKIVSWNDD